MTRLIIFLALITTFSPCFANEQKIDSLKSVLATLKDDTTKVNVLNDISHELYVNSPDESIKYAKNAHLLAEKINYLKGAGYALQNIGLGYYIQGSYTKVLNYWNQSFIVFKSIGDEGGMANIESNLGSVYSNLGDDLKAIEYLQKVLIIAENTNDTLRIATTLLNIGALYSYKKDTIEAEEYYKRGYQIAKQDKDAKHIIGYLTTDLGEIYLEQERYDSALFYLQVSIDAFVDEVDIPQSLILIGRVYREKGDFNEAFKYLDSAFELAERLDLELEMVSTLLGLAETYQLAGNLNKALKTSKIAEAISKEIGADYLLIDTYERLITIFEGQSDFKNAVKYSKLLATINSNLYTKLIEEKTNNLNYLTKTKNQSDSLYYANKNIQLEFLAKQERKKSQLYLLLTIGIIIVVTASAGIILKYINQKRRMRNQSDALEKEREYSHRLQHIDTLKDQFLANTSHELRTPLNGIIGLAESLYDGSAGEVSTKAKVDLEMIRTSGKRLAHLINDILDFSKLKNKDVALTLTTVDIRIVVNIVIRICQQLAQDKNVVISNAIPKELPSVYADENRVQQILYNLIGNAIKFTESGEIIITGAKKDNMVEITISDTGIGISKDKIRSIFDSFEQAEGSIEREYGGTGLGLTVTKQLLELQNGTIQVESEQGQGSKFTFTLPVSTEENKMSDTQHVAIEDEELSTIEKGDVLDEGQQSVEEKLNGIEILIVDDEPVNREVLHNRLNLAGYVVKQASRGMEALKMLDNGPCFDLVILDIMMPKMSGYEVCSKLREKFLPSELPIIMLTAKNRVTDLVEGFNVGANDYLTKPFSKNELLSRVKTHLNLGSINKATGKFVPNEFLRAIGRESVTEVCLGDFIEKNVTVFFSDIREYTTLAEKMTPEENFKFINAYVGRMGPIIQENKGFVNQYLGDGIVAMFPEDVDKALNSAINMQQAILKYSYERQQKGRSALHVGMGLHSGSLIMGIIGDAERNDPATIADTVNAASRMEGLTKYYGANIIISENSIELLNNKSSYNLRYLGKVQLKGKHQAIGVYECFDGDEDKDLKLKTLPNFEEGLDGFFNKDFAQASATFDRIVKVNPKDKVAMYFRHRAAEYTANSVPEDWTGIEVFDKK